MRYRLITALAAAGAIATLGFAAPAAAQQPPCPYAGGYGPGYGMMGGYGPGWMMGYPHGYMMGPGYGRWGGYHHGWMRGPGYRYGQGGYHHGWMRPGYGYGPGGYHHGWMRPGYGYGPGGYHHGWMMGRGSGPGYGYHHAQRNLNLSVDDVKAYLQQMIRNPNLKVGEVKEKDANTITAQVVTKKDDSLVQTFEVNRHTGFYQPGQ